MTCYVEALLSMGKQGTKSFARALFFVQWTTSSSLKLEEFPELFVAYNLFGRIVG